jgi:hypothetical protein
MPQTSFALTPDDVAIDENGRVIVNNPSLVAQIQAAVVAKAEPTNGNCSGCNTAAHCGVKLQ